MTALFVQPHFDDVALSAGGMVALRTMQGERVVIVTLFSDPPPPDAVLTDFARELHASWGLGDEAIAVRRREDHAAAAILGAETHWLGHREALYRGEQYCSREALFGEITTEDQLLCRRIGDQLLALCKEMDAEVYLPLAVGEHVDHVLCYRAAATLASAGAPLKYYEDFPYVFKPGALDRRVAAIPGLRAELVDVTTVLDRRIAAVAAYASQISTLFRRENGDHEAPIRRHAQAVSGQPGRYAERLWSTIS
jgi:LmbE family N-acetylglucosaminyl deacetylase